MSTPRERVTFIPADAEDGGMREGPATVSDDLDLQEQFEEFFNRTRDTDTEVTVRVYRIPIDGHGNPVTTGKMSFLFGSPLDAFTLDQMYERLKREFIRPGESSITVRMICSQKGIAGVRFNRVTSVERGADEARRADNAEPTVLTAVSKMLADQQTRTDAMFREFFSRSINPTQTDPLAPILGLVTAFMPAITAFISREPASGGGLGDALKAIQVAKGLVGAGGGTAESDDDSVTGIMKAASPFAGVLEAIVKRLGAPEATQAPRLPAPPPQPAPARVAPVATAPAPVAVATAPIAPAPGPAEKSQMFMELADNLTKLSAMVTINKPETMDPTQIAKMIADGMPEDLPPDVEGILFAADGYDRLKAIAPKIDEHRDWFVALLAALRAEYSDETPAPG